MAAHFELNRASNGKQFYFVLKAGNGEVILTSEMYEAKGSAENGIASVQKNSPEADRYERKQAKDGRHYFVLKAANHQVIGQSQMYASAASMEGGITSVQKNGGTTEVKDNSAG